MTGTQRRPGGSDRGAAHNIRPGGQDDTDPSLRRRRAAVAHLRRLGYDVAWCAPGEVSA